MEQAENRRLLFGDRLQVYLPGAYQAMDAEKAGMFYPYENRPQVILEDEETGRWCTFSLLKDQGLSRGQTGDAIESVSKAVLSLYPSGLIRKPQILRRKKGDCGWFAFRTAWKKGELYNVMYVFSVDGSMMLGTLGCGAEDAEGIKGMMKILKSLEVPVTEPSYVKARRMMFS